MALKIIVLLKMIPDVVELRFNPTTRTLVREGVKNRLNQFDRRAIEEGLRIKERAGGTVNALTMGPPQAEEVLREALAMGTGGAFLLTDRAFAGSDTLATSRALALASKKVGFDLILGGKHSLDAETGQLIPEVAQLVGASLVTNVSREEFLGGGLFRVEREYEEGIEEFEVGTPAVMSVGEKINVPRTPNPEQRERASSVPITIWSAADLSEDQSLFGAAGSPTVVNSIYDASYSRTPVVFDGRGRGAEATREALDLVQELLKEKSRPGKTARADPSGKVAWSVFLAGSDETRTATEVLGKAKSMGLASTAVLVGRGLEATEEGLARAGADLVLQLDLGMESSWSSAAFAAALSAAIASEGPYAVFFPSTVRGREVAGRVAASLGIGLTGDATDLVFDERGELLQVKPAFGGNIMAAILSKTTPQAATIRPGVFEESHFESSSLNRSSRQVSIALSEKVSLLSRRVTIDSAVGDLDRSKVLLGIGFGAGSPEGFNEVKEYAARIGLGVGATRKVVDLGWAPPQLQVGLTGKSVSPELYVAVGISGAAYHGIGIRKAKVVLALNADPNAPIFKACDVGVIADYHEILPLIESRLRSLQAELSSAA